MTFKKYENISLSGQTGLRSKSLFAQRKGYDAFYPTVFDSTFPTPIDFRNPTYQKYGLVDSNKEYMILDPAYLKPLVGAKESIYALSFVADAYQDFLFYMNTKGIPKMMPDGGRLKKDMTAKLAWKNSDVDYESLKSGIYESFVQTFLDIDSKPKIKNIEGFMDIFLNFYLNFMNFDIPITYTGLMQSSYADPRYSGLCIHLETGDLDSDYEKFDQYINNRNFKEYATAAAAFGFMVDKHIPWRLVANVRSPKMSKYINNHLNFINLPRSGPTELTKTPYLSNNSTHAHLYFIDEYGNGYTDEHDAPGDLNKHHGHKIIDYKIIPNGTPKANDPNTGIEPHIHELQIPQVNWSLKDLYDEYYFRAEDIDIDNLKDMMFELYNRYVNQQPFSSIPQPCKTAKSKADLGGTNFALLPLAVTKIFRTLILRERYEAEYDDLFWYKIYFLIRLRELRAETTPAKITNNLAKIEDLYLNIDKEASMSYIISYLKQFY